MATAVQALARIKKEYKEVQNAKEAGVSAELVNDSFARWKGVITGPDGTPYQGGTFYVDIEIPPNYPFVPPKMRFETKVWHPNVSSANALLSLQALLSCPNADDPQDGVVAGQYKSDRKLFEKTAAFWTSSYAQPKKAGATFDEAKVKNLVQMGFPTAAVQEALTKTKNDENAALEWLLTNPPAATATATAAAPSTPAKNTSSAAAAAAAAAKPAAAAATTPAKPATPAAAAAAKK